MCYTPLMEYTLTREEIERLKNSPEHTHETQAIAAKLISYVESRLDAGNATAIHWKTETSHAHTGDIAIYIERSGEHLYEFRCNEITAHINVNGKRAIIEIPK